jgi:hypothetical protein
MKKNTTFRTFRAHSFAWVTAALFFVALVGHWILGWYAFAEEQREHGKQPEVGAYAIELGRDTLENWQSEFLQLIWQVAGLAFLFHYGSPQSREGDDRKEAKLDAILEHLDPKEAKAIIAKLDRQFPRQ